MSRHRTVPCLAVLHTEKDSTLNENIIGYEIVGETYVDIDETVHKNIFISYPQLIHSSDMNKEQIINDQIKKTALDILNGFSLDGYDLETTYSVTFNNPLLRTIVICK